MPGLSTFQKHIQQSGVCVVISPIQLKAWTHLVFFQLRGISNITAGIFVFLLLDLPLDIEPDEVFKRLAY